MLTRDQALNAHEFHYGKCIKTVGPRGGVTVKQAIYRRNGQTKTWKTRPNEFRIPVKYGMYNYEYITERDAVNVHTESECPLHAV